MNIIIDVIDEESGLLLNPDTGTIRVDTKLLREQRDALLTSIDLARRGFGCPDGVSGEKQILMLDGLVNMFDAILDCAECEAVS